MDGSMHAWVRVAWCLACATLGVFANAEPAGVAPPATAASVEASASQSPLVPEVTFERIEFRTESQLVLHLEKVFAARFDAARARAEAAGFTGLRAYVLDHPDFGDTVLMLRFVPQAGDRTAQSNALLQALVPWLGSTPFRFVAIDIADTADDVLRMQAFRWGYWRTRQATWIALGDDPYAYFAARAGESAGATSTGSGSDAAGEAREMHVRALLQMGLIDRARDFPARSRKLLRQSLAEVTHDAAQPSGRRSALEMQVLDALLSDAVANRDDIALTPAEVDAWSARLLELARSLEVPLGHGPIYVVAPRFRRCTAARRATWTVLADGHVANAQVARGEQRSRNDVACAIELAEALAQWRFVPPSLLGAAAPVQRSEVFEGDQGFSTRALLMRTRALMNSNRAASGPRSTPGL